MLDELSIRESLIGMATSSRRTTQTKRAALYVRVSTSDKGSTVEAHPAMGTTLSRLTTLTGCGQGGRDQQRGSAGRFGIRHRLVRFAGGLCCCMGLSCRLSGKGLHQGYELVRGVCHDASIGKLRQSVQRFVGLRRGHGASRVGMNDERSHAR